jgi:type IV secretion system protein VirD4
MNFDDLPRGLPATPASTDKAPRALWVAPEVLAEQKSWTYETGKIFLGKSDGKMIGKQDDRHLLTIAGSRTGKGTSAIVPNLLLYPGSVLVIDPKGENATLTAERRGQGRNIPNGGLEQDVFVIDPFGVADVDDVYRAGFNPLAGLNPLGDDFIDECDAIADALVVEEKQGTNSYFYDSARLILRGYIAWVVSHPEIRDKSLNEVRRLLFLPRVPVDPDEEPDEQIPDVNDPTLSFDQLNAMMSVDTRFAFGIPFEAASTLKSMGLREFGSTMSTIRNQIGFISSPPMSRILEGGERSPDLKQWKHGGHTVYQRVSV